MTEQNSSNIENKTAQSLEKDVSDTNITNIDNKDILQKNASSFSPLLKKTLIIAIAAVIASIIAVIIIVSVKHKSKKNVPRIIMPDNSSSNSTSSSSTPPSSSASSSSSVPPSSNSSSSSSTPPSSSGSSSSSASQSSKSASSSSSSQSQEPFKPTYEEAEKLLDSEIIGENHKILNESFKSIGESLEVFKNLTTDFKPIKSNISFSTPDFLVNLTNDTLKIVKDDINLYNSKYKELEGKANNLTETVSESIKNLSTPINNMKQNQIITQDDYILQ